MSRRLSVLARSAGLNKPRGGDAVVRSLGHDSRRVSKGSLFAALPSAVGNAVDSAAHARQALDKGAAALLAPKDWKLGAPTLVEKNVRDAYGKLAAAFHGWPTKRMKLAGITGTNGKTTTAYLLYGMLKRRGDKPALIGTVAYQIAGKTLPAPNTTPSSLDIQQMLAKALKAGAKSAVMEVSSHALDQQRVAGCRFDVGVFTNLTQDHLDYHRSMDAYRKAKAGLFALVKQSKGEGVWNLDDPAHVAMKRALGRKGWGYSLSKPKAEVFAEELELDLSGSRFVLATPAGRAPLRFPLAGRYNVANALAAAAAALALGLDLASIAAGLETPMLPPGRLQRVDGGRDFAVLVDYAHTPDALARAVAAVREGTPGRVITVFGAGGDRDRSKRPKMAKAAYDGSDLVIVTSDNPRTEDPERILDDVFKGIPKRQKVQKSLRLADRSKAIERAVKLARSGDTVLIAGKGHEDYQVLGTVKVPFSDVVEARKALKGRR